MTTKFKQKSGGWMETHNGMAVSFINPDPDTILLDDIAMSLARTCRYGGHVNGRPSEWYSVAEHSMLIRWTACLMGKSIHEQWTALMHDAAEAYIGDHVHPFKALIPDISMYEDRLMAVIAEKFDLIYPFPAWLEDIDARITQDERTWVMSPSQNDWGMGHVEPLGFDKDDFKRLNPDDAYLIFKRMAEDLYATHMQEKIAANNNGTPVHLDGTSLGT